MVEAADRRRSRAVGRLLQAGVTLAGGVVVAGAIPYLVVHGFERPDYAVFRGEPRMLRSVTGIVADALSGDSRGILQLGILILIATPVSRVVLLLADFWRDRDTLYVAVTTVVLGILAYSLLGSGFL
jgi:uncharacterized membrane protein